MGINSVFFLNTTQKINVSETLLMNSVFLPGLILSVGLHITFSSIPFQEAWLCSRPEVALWSHNVGRADRSFGETAKIASAFE